MLAKPLKAVIVLLALLGVYLLVSQLRNYVLDIGDADCYLLSTHSFPSPDQAYAVVDAVVECPTRGIERAVTLQPMQGHPHSVPVIYRSGLQSVRIEQQELAPPPIGVAWLGDRKLSLMIPDQNAQQLQPRRFEEVLVVYMQYGR